MLLLRLAWFTILALNLGAATIYRIDFEGTVADGAVSSATQTDLAQTPFDLTGARVTGYLLLDLSLAPAFIDSSDGVSTSRFLGDLDGADWLNGSIEVDLPSLPSDFLSVPGALTIGPAATGPDFTPSSPSTATRNLLATSSQSCCDLISVNAAFNTSGSSSTGQVFTANSLLQLLLLPGSSFLPADVPFPAPFTTGPSLISSRFVYVGFDQDANNTTPPLLGASRSFSYDVDFLVTSASGNFVDTSAPEPSTLLLCGIGLTGAAAIRRRFCGK